jgi:hypothetical protein
LGLRAGRCSPEDPIYSDAIEVGVLTGVRLERRWRKGATGWGGGSCVRGPRGDASWVGGWPE